MTNPATYPAVHMSRRAFVGAAAAVPLWARAQPFPGRPIQIVVPFGPGGATDAVFRIISEPLGKRLGQPVLVMNRPGGATTIGMGAVAKAAPDGHTLGVASLSFTANGAFMQGALPYDPARDFIPISLVFRVPMVMTVNSQVPARTLRELIGLARATPSQLNYASSGVASSGHVAAALFESMTGTALTHVPYNTLPLPAVVAGDTQLLIGPVAPALSFIRSGRLRALGVTTQQRLGVLPDVPTFAEDGVPGYEFFEWAGLVAPAGTPADVTARIHRELAGLLEEESVRNRIAALGAEVIGNSPAQFRTFMQHELARWADLGQRNRDGAAAPKPARP